MQLVFPGLPEITAKLEYNDSTHGGGGGTGDTLGIPKVIASGKNLSEWENILSLLLFLFTEMGRATKMQF